jgi:glycosyltransferase involved in cell wall biosynthesis
MAPRRILYVQYTDPAAYPPIEHSSCLLADRGWEVLLLGVANTLTCNLQFPLHPRVHVKMMRFVEGGLRQKLNYLSFALYTVYWTWRWRPSWVYASDPLSCPIVSLVQKLTKINVIYHEHDSPNFDGAQSWFMKKVFAHRGRLARDAELCILPQRARLRKFLEATGRTKPALCVWNCPRVDEMVDTNANQDHELIIYYHGSISRARLPTQVVVAASRFKGAVRVQVAGYEVPGSIGYVEELIGLAAENGSADIIEALGTIPRRQDLLHSAARAHVGLSLMPKKSDDINMQQMVGASNKPFDYMACGIPLLVSSVPEWVSTFVDSGFAVACDPDDPDSIEAALRWYLEHPEQRREMGQKCKAKISEAWNYENEFASVLKAIERGDEIS